MHRRAVLRTAIAPLLLGAAASCATAPGSVDDVAGSAFVTTADGIRVHYMDGGGDDAQAIVLVHGWSCDVRTWREQIPVLARRARVLAVDLPGHGASDRPRRDYGMDLAAGAIADAMDDAGVERAVLVGHSNGTPVTRQFYRRHPERTLGIVVVDGPLKRVFEDVEQAESTLSALEGDGREEFIARFAESMTATMDPEDAATVRDMLAETPAHVQRSVFESALDPAIWKDDPIEVPVLVVNTEAPFWDEEYRAYVHALAPDLEYHELSGRGHFLHMEDPATFHRLVLGWLQRKRLL